MNKFLLFIETMPLVFISLLCLILFFILYFIQYIYISYNLKGICKIIFDNERNFKIPLEPFNCFFISVLPIVFWREILNIKYGVSFKKIYKKDFYYPMEENQLKELLKNFTLLFNIQYVIYLSGILFILFGGFSYVLDKYF
ncbi:MULTISPECIES: hypothetical protein [Acinetobacter]|uniref:hypothetical protein n=1 Tax=Acinetobacter TaxID=469 RepID=UPI00097F7E48|nr:MULTISPECIES: hypothetical protein [Acinetobacter]MEB3796244.1 hypothetical protein [Acinetobacter sp. IK24]MEB3815434.1 hypothetical protein [Acinetobacter sp. IK22]MEB3834638.1 hypothetical protein [Acinetobacter sp. IK23]MEB3839105.1 hypothetical protein [Acinetobacter sp. IK25]ONN57757.1 hypothetical protein AC057_06975 [Acinetobacter genomosp. 33YU]